MSKLLKYIKAQTGNPIAKNRKKELSLYDNYISPIVQKTANIFSMNVFNKSHDNFIDNLENVSPSINGQYQKGNHILGGDFIEKTNDGIFKKKEWVKKPKNATIGDKKIPLSNINNFYGIEDNNFKVGSLKDFKDDTDLVPVRSKNTSVYSAKKETDKGIFYDNESLVLRDSLGKRIHNNIKNSGKLIMYSPVTKKKIFLNGEVDYEINEINKFIKSNPQSKYVMLDNGRFYNHLTNKEGLKQEDFNVYNTGTFNAGETKNYNIVSSKKQTGGGKSTLDGTAVSKKYISPLEKQRINNNYLKSLVNKNKTYLNPQGNTSQRVKDIALQEQANERINSRQDKANMLGAVLTPIPAVGGIYNTGNMIAQGVVDAMQGEYGNALTSAIPYGLGKVNKVPGVLNNAYKYNPFAKRLNNSEMGYRVLGEEGYKDAITSGVLRAKQNPQIANGKISLVRNTNRNPNTGRLQPTLDRPYFADGFVDERYGADYVAEVNKAKNNLVPIETHKGIAPGTVTNIPLENANIYKKNWLRGYEKQQVGGDEINSPNVNYANRLPLQKPYYKRMIDEVSNGLDIPHKKLMELFGGNGDQTYSEILNENRNLKNSKVNNVVYDYLDKVNPKILDYVGDAGDFFVDPIMLGKAKRAKMVLGSDRIIESTNGLYKAWKKTDAVGDAYQINEKEKQQVGGMNKLDKYIDYRQVGGLKKSQQDLKNWSNQKWRTNSGKKSSETGERYLPDKAWDSLSDSEKARTNRAKREGGGTGKNIPQPKDIAQKTSKFRKAQEGFDDEMYYKSGGSTVNSAGNYTKPEMRKRLFNRIKGEASMGTAAGQWSGRKAQYLSKKYKSLGGGYKD